MFGLLFRLIVALGVVVLLPGLLTRLLPGPMPEAPTVPALVRHVFEADPGAYDGRLVRLTGQVRHTLSTPFGSYWTLDDGSATALLIALGNAPQPGERVQVRVSVYPLLAIGWGPRLGLLLVAMEPPQPERGGG